MDNSELNKLIKKTISFFPKGKALDLGAGEGDKTLLLKKAGFDVTAIEYKRKLIEIIQKKGLKTVCRDISKFNFSKNLYSLVFASASLDFLGRKEKAAVIRKMYTSLVPGGNVFLLVFSKKDPLYLAAQKWREIERATYIVPKKIRKHAKQISFFSREEWQKTLSKADFQEIRISEIFIEEWQPSSHDHVFYKITARK